MTDRLQTGLAGEDALDGDGGGLSMETFVARHPHRMRQERDEWGTEAAWGQGKTVSGPGPLLAVRGL